MKELIEPFKKLGYNIPEKYFDEQKKLFDEWTNIISKINFNQHKKISEDITKIDAEIKNLNESKDKLLLKESEGVRVCIFDYLYLLFSIHSLEFKRNILYEKEIFQKQILKEIGRTGGRPEKSFKNHFVLKPNGLIEAQLNSNLLMKYYLKFRPEYFQDMTPEEISVIVNSQTFYHFSSVFPFLEDAILSLGAFHVPEITTDHFVYTIDLETFLKESGAVGVEKFRLIAFLRNNFSGEFIYKTPILRVENGKLEIWNTLIFNVDLGIAENGDQKIKFFLNRYIFGNVIGQAKPKNYMLYPRQLNKKLNKSTKGRWIVQIRSLFDFLQRELENKSVTNKPLALVMASIGYSSAFKNFETFAVNSTRARYFIEKALPAINNVGIRVRKDKKSFFYGVRYEIRDQHVIFNRESRDDVASW